MDHSDYDAIKLRLEPWIRATIRDEMQLEKDGVKRDGPTVAEWVAAGYSASSYPPTGYQSRSTPEEIAAAVAAQEAVEVDGPSIESATPAGEPATLDKSDIDPAAQSAGDVA